MGRITIVDGYNVIRCDPNLAQIERRCLEQAREMLIRRLAADAHLVKDDIIVVFDGAKGGQPFEICEQRRRLRVIYSRLGESADEVIKRLVRDSQGNARVISNDRELRDFASAHGSTPMRVAPRPRFPPASAADDEEEPPRRSKKGPAHRAKKRHRRPDPYWSP